MRENIGLFKARRIDNGEWVQGSLVVKKDTGNDTITCYIIRPSYVHFNTSHIVHTEVDPETVCEFTGLLDKDSKKIFEGDFCKVKNIDIVPKNYELKENQFLERIAIKGWKIIGWYGELTCYFNEKECAFKFKDDEKDLGLIECEIEVIGNKFDK